MMIIGTIFYLQVSMSIFTLMYCTNVDGTLRLSAELNVVCFQGEHLPAVMFALVLLVVYVIVFPSAVSYAILQLHRRADGDEDLWKTVYVQRYGYLLHNLKVRPRLALSFGSLSFTYVWGYSGPVLLVPSDPLPGQLHYRLGVRSG